jgi:hypothetical protein
MVVEKHSTKPIELLMMTIFLKREATVIPILIKVIRILIMILITMRDISMMKISVQMLY